MIPWWVAEEAHKEYAKRHNQPLETTAKRGGFGWLELVLLLKGKSLGENLDDTG